VVAAPADDVEGEAATQLLAVRLGRKRLRSALAIDTDADSSRDAADGPTTATPTAAATAAAAAADPAEVARLQHQQRQRRQRQQEGVDDDNGAPVGRTSHDLPFLGTVAPFVAATPPRPAAAVPAPAPVRSSPARRDRRRGRTADGSDHDEQEAPAGGLGFVPAEDDAELSPAASDDDDDNGGRGGGRGAQRSRSGRTRAWQPGDDDVLEGSDVEQDSDGGGEGSASSHSGNSSDDDARAGRRMNLAEAYFARRGRNAGARGRVGRGKRGGARGGRRRRGGRGYLDEDEDKEKNAQEAREEAQAKRTAAVRTMTSLPAVSDEALRAALAAMPDPFRAARAALADLHASQYAQWRLELAEGFSLLFYGLGSKKTLLLTFAERALTDAPVVVVNGYSPAVSVRALLVAITRAVVRQPATFRSMQDHALWLAQQLAALHGRPRLYLLVLSIDAPAMRTARMQTVLSVLAAASGVRLVASADHVQGALLWSGPLAARFNWVWHDGTTFAPFTHETAGEASVLGDVGQATVRSVGHVLRSLTANARDIFTLLARHQLEQDACRRSDRDAGEDGDDDGGDGGGAGAERGLSFAAYYAKCLDDFLVSNDVALRAQLTEFRDHRIIQTVTGADGTEYLHIPLSASALTTVLEAMDGGGGGRGRQEDDDDTHA
jgi:origin recognition complex subunit 2